MAVAVTVGVGVADGVDVAAVVAVAVGVMFGVEVEAAVTVTVGVAVGDGVGVPVGVAVGVLVGATVSVSVAVLLAGFGSVTDEEATAVLVSVVPAEAVTLTTIETGTVVPDAMVPRLKVTVPFVPKAGPVQLPVGVKQETKVVPLGIGSLTITAVAGSGPPLLTEML